MSEKRLQMERLVFIGMLVFLAFVFIGILFWLRYRMKNTFENGVPVYDAPANNQTRTSKLSVGEYAVHIVLILISAVIAFKVMGMFRHGHVPSWGSANWCCYNHAFYNGAFQCTKENREILDRYRCSAYGICIFDVRIHTDRFT